ncbi:MAG TPA: ABC transporter permease [Puia sp.]|nr:ABC transporter permease [Puia sp.]
MFKNYLKIALRSIMRHKAYSIINISGLAIGMASSILILLWVQNELSYDRWHKHANQIYRITSAAEGFKTAVSCAGFPRAFQAAIPGIKNTVRLSDIRSVLFTIGDKKFKENRTFYTDSTFLDVFSFPLVKGDPKTALMRPDGVVITEELATKYFGKDNPLGKVLRKDNHEDVVVTGVLKNIPDNSHLQFDVLLSLSSPAVQREMNSNLWDNFSFYDYLQLDDHFNATPAALAGIEGQMNKIFKDQKTGIRIDLRLQPLTRIHLHSNLQIDLPGQGDIQYVNIFFIVAIFILVVACINFMNLATARSARRAKEVGLRKVVGAVRGQLIGQFLGESLLISFFSLLIAMLVVWLVLPSFAQLAGKTLSVSIWDGKLLLTLIGISIATGLISGSYPALFLSGFQPVKVLKGNLKSLGGNRFFRNALVVVQFVVSIVLLIGTVVIYNQLRYIKNRNLGFEKSNLVYMYMQGNMWNKKQALYDGLAQSPLTSDFTVTDQLPINLYSGTVNVIWPGKDPKVQIVFPSMQVSETFFDIFHMKMLNGRPFSKDFKADTSNFILNETAARTMGMTAANAVGQQISFQDSKGTIVGVVQDFNYKPIQRTIEPLIMQLNRWGGVIVVRTKPGSAEATIKTLSKLSMQYDPAYPVAYGFLDQDLANQYKGEQQMGSIFNLFALLAIFISCLGLYGLSAYMAEQRTKEIGVRKVLGASLLNIVRLLSTDFTRLIIIAMIIAIPLAWWAVNKWLESFAYHIHVGWPIFVLGPIAALFIAWITVSYESVKAGVTNPVKSLRSE